jgi:hypothetical protein
VPNPPASAAPAPEVKAPPKSDQEDAVNRLKLAVRGVTEHKEMMMASVAGGQTTAASTGCALWASYQTWFQMGLTAANDLAGFGVPYAADGQAAPGGPDGHQRHLSAAALIGQVSL